MRPFFAGSPAADSAVFRQSRNYRTGRLYWPFRLAERRQIATTQHDDVLGRKRKLVPFKEKERSDRANENPIVVNVFIARVIFAGAVFPSIATRGIEKSAIGDIVKKLRPLDLSQRRMHKKDYRRRAELIKSLITGK